MTDDNLELFVSCLAGMEPLLADELRGLGARRVRPLSGGVACEADRTGAYQVCLWSRLASRVMLVVGRCDCSDADALYEGARAMAWEDVVASGVSIAVRAQGTNDQLRNTRFTALKVKDAVCDRLRDVRGARPDVDTAAPDALIDVRVRERRATLSLDLAGASLYRRSYLSRDDSPEAPLTCALACGTLALAGWPGRAAGGWALLDPACADGVLVLEAASAACDLAPGLVRDSWGFFGWARHDQASWERLLDEADARFERGLCAVAPGATDVPASSRPDLRSVRFVGACTSSPQISRARERAKRAGLRQVVSFEYGAAEDAPALVERVRAASGASAGMLVATQQVAPARGSQAQVQAQAQADAAAFVAAAEAAGPGSAFAVSGNDVAAVRFGAQLAHIATFGHGRIAATARYYDRPPAQLVPIAVADASGGREHRVLAFEATSSQFAARLHKTFKERRKWAKREGVGCYRLYDADLPDYAVAIDVYEGTGQARGNTYVHIAEYAPPASIDAVKARRRLDDVLSIAPVVLGVRPDHVFLKTRERDKGGVRHAEGARRSYVTTVEEDGYVLEVDLAGYLDTGLFLDHRPTRRRIEELSAGARFLNLFAYTGTATVRAAGGGAAETCTVDLSQTYLDWARRNMALNGFTGAMHSFVRADAMTWITECRRSPRRFDLIFVDPPTFSNSKAMGRRTWDVQRDHVELLIGVSRLLAPDGLAIFSCNLRTFKPDLEALARYGVSMEDVSAQSIPHDFERTPRIHRCYLVRRV